MIVRGTSTHLIGQHAGSRATTKFVFLEIVFRLEAKIIKLKAGCGGFICQYAKALPANIIVLLAPPWKLFFLPRSHLALRSANFNNKYYATSALNKKTNRAELHKTISPPPLQTNKKANAQLETPKAQTSPLSPPLFAQTQNRSNTKPASSNFFITQTKRCESPTGNFESKTPKNSVSPTLIKQTDRTVPC